MSIAEPVATAQRAATVAWSRRVRRVGGFIQVGFAAFWLIRGALNITKPAGTALAILFVALVTAVVAYGIRATAGKAPRPTSPEGQHLERAITVATVVQLIASFAAPAAVIAAGQSDWVLPSIAITIGPLLLWLDHRVAIPRYRPVGATLIVGPVLLAATMTGSSLAAATGISAGVLLLATAAAGFRDLTLIRLADAPAETPLLEGGIRRRGWSRTRIASFVTVVIGGTIVFVLVIHVVTGSWATGATVSAIATGLTVTGYAALGRRTSPNQRTPSIKEPTS